MKLDGDEKQEADPLLVHVLDRLTAEMTVLDVGSGIGRWALPMARRVRRVTAVEPLQGMRQVLVERVAAQGITTFGDRFDRSPTVIKAYNLLYQRGRQLPSRRTSAFTPSAACILP